MGIFFLHFLYANSYSNGKSTPKLLKSLDLLETGGSGRLWENYKLYSETVRSENVLSGICSGKWEMNDDTIALGRIWFD